jgi:hypothetical protein
MMSAPRDSSDASQGSFDWRSDLICPSTQILNHASGWGHML